MIRRFFQWLIRLFSSNEIIYDDNISERWLEEHVYRDGKEGFKIDS